MSIVQKFRDARDAYGARFQPHTLRVIAGVFWRTLLVCAFFAVIALAVFGAWKFFGTVRMLSEAQVAASAPKPLIDEEALEEILSALRERRSDYNAARIDGPSLVDPSK
jgi:hypothetical protein